VQNSNRSCREGEESIIIMITINTLMKDESEISETGMRDKNTERHKNRNRNPVGKTGNGRCTA
jgi:hypothetical protein